MPYTSHGHPFGVIDTDQPRPTTVARCGGPRICRICVREAAAHKASGDRRHVAEEIARAIEAVDPVEWALAGQRAGQDAARIAREIGERDS